MSPVGAPSRTMHKPLPRRLCGADRKSTALASTACDPYAPRVFRQTRTIGARISMVAKMIEHSQI
jgi:hypothetical protein